MTDAELEELEGPWLLIKRGLYYRPNGNGYTGAKIMAGRFSKVAVDMARDVATPVLESKASLVSPGACPMAVASEYETLLRSLREENAELKRDCAPVSPEALAWAKEEAARIEAKEAARDRVVEAARVWKHRRGRDAGLYDIAKQRLEDALAALEEVKP